jgi:hypothetical protein
MRPPRFGRCTPLLMLNESTLQCAFWLLAADSNDLARVLRYARDFNRYHQQISKKMETCAVAKTALEA